MMKEMQSKELFRAQPSPEWCPHLNLYETPENFVVCVEVAGIDHGKIDVQAHDGMLSISGVREKPFVPDSPSRISVHLMEIDSGRFHRQVPMPTDVNVDEIQATYQNGYLWVILPRKTDTRGTHDHGR
jgi:HSP20 family protein